MCGKRSCRGTHRDVVVEEDVGVVVLPALELELGVVVVCGQGGLGCAYGVVVFADG
jgi:hypothetical protein